MVNRLASWVITFAAQVLGVVDLLFSRRSPQKHDWNSPTGIAMLLRTARGHGIDDDELLDAIIAIENASNTSPGQAPVYALAALLAAKRRRDTDHRGA